MPLQAQTGSGPVGEQPAQDTASARDLGELERVYRAHHAFVWRSLLRLGIPRDAVDDAVHDTFLVVARRLHEFQGRASYKTWLFAIAFQVARSFRRDQARTERLALAVAHAGAVSGRPPEEQQHRESASLLHELLRTLDPEKRAVFIMAELEGMTAPEMAAALGLKVPTVYSRLRLARAQLDKAVAALRQTRKAPAGD